MTYNNIFIVIHDSTVEDLKLKKKKFGRIYLKDNFDEYYEEIRFKINQLTNFFK